MVKLSRYGWDIQQFFFQFILRFACARRHRRKYAICLNPDMLSIGNGFSMEDVRDAY